MDVKKARTGALTVRLHGSGELHLLAPRIGSRQPQLTSCGMNAMGGKCEGTTDAPDCDIDEVCGCCIRAWGNEDPDGTR